MHSEPDPQDREHEDDGTWFQPSSESEGGAHASSNPTPGPVPPDSGTPASPSGAKLPIDMTPTEGPAREAFPTAETAGGGKAPVSDSALGSGPGSSLGTGSSRESGDWDASPPPMIAKGLMIFGKYQLAEMIGEGGMGQVWKVRHIELDSDRALKLIKPEIAKNAEGWKRFRREARVMDRLGQHPNSVAIYDFKRIQSMAYIEMAFVRGQSLDKVLSENGGKPMPLAWIVSILRQLCSVLHEAHSHVDESTGHPKPIVHRDLKPSNLMLVDSKPEGQNLKVLDFGIAKMVDDKGAEDERTLELTGASVFLGTAGYASPEQIRGDKEIDGRSDLYSTGVMLYQFLTGELPFRGNRMAMLAAHMMRPPAPMKETNPDAQVPPAVEEVVQRCLAKNPEERYQTAAELLEAFSKAVGEVGSEPVWKKSKAKTAPKGTKEQAEKRGGSPLWPIAAAAVLLLGVVGGGAAFVMNRGKARVSDIPKVGTEGPVTKKPDVPDTPKIATPTTKPLPERYVAAGAKLDNDGYPRALTRQSDNIRFNRLNEVAYLPEGYEAAKDQPYSGWPDVIVRTKGNVRFVRIRDKQFYQGDPQAIDKSESGKPAAGGETLPEPEADQEGNLCTPHLVDVSSFYIQESEVTNGEIEDYLKGQSEAKKREFDEWRESVRVLEDSLDKDHNAARYYPAVCISYNAARDYAKEIGGRLPTEAEWELAAKSGDDYRQYAWELPPAEDNKPMAHLSYHSANKTARMPVKVKSYLKTDRTDQNVYDMIGNVREWCLDMYRPYADILAKRQDPRKPLKDDPDEVQKPIEGKEPEHVVKGGSFLTDLPEAKSFQRTAEPPDQQKLDIGFRVVISCPRIDRVKSPASAAAAP